MVGDGERRGQPRRLDAEEVHHSRDAVPLRALYEQVARGLAPRLYLGPDAAVGGLQAAVLELGPVAAYGLVEDAAAAGVDVVVDALYPLDVGAEARLPREVQGEMHAEARRLGSRVRSEEHTSELQSLTNLVCRLLLEKKTR